MDLPQFSDRACPYYPAMLIKAQNKANKYNKLLDEAKAKGKRLEPIEIKREVPQDPITTDEEEGNNKAQEIQENKDTDADRDAEFDLEEIWEKREKIKTFETKTRTMLRLAHAEMEKLQSSRDDERKRQMEAKKKMIETIKLAQRTSETGRTKDTLFSTTAKTASIPRVNWRTITRDGPPPNGGDTASIEPSTPGKDEQGPGQEI